ncbi:MAG: HD-GYP domain-containing protein [Chloroflexi bacterium]|nr:HD-GYP domain-containing protein [Chloroflexota bacterium]
MIALRDDETEVHSKHVTEITEKMARSLGISGDALLYIRWGALLHDVGKVGVPDNILLKPGPLTPDERKIMMLHPELGYQILLPLKLPAAALEIPHYHHEKWDGSGYPSGLSGENIPLSARIFTFVDVWDALSSDRPYRAAWTTEKITEYVIGQAGTKFDPQLVESFLKTVSA